MRSKSRPGGVRRNIYLDVETDQWLTEQATRIPGGRSGVIRKLVQEARERGGLGAITGIMATPTGGGLSSSDREALIEEISRRVLAELLIDAARQSSARSGQSGAGMSEDETRKLSQAAAKTARRFIDPA